VEETISFEARKGNFSEIVKTADEDVAITMAARCFYCGICIQCDWCYFYSDNSIVKKIEDWSPEKDRCYYVFIKENISSHTFKSVEACPRSALSVINDGHKFEKYISSQFTEFERLKRGSNIG